MNYVYIYSGLGNQMFQYAFYIGLKQKSEYKVKPFVLRNTGHNGYELKKVFGINCEDNLWTTVLRLPHTGRIMKLFLMIHHTFPVHHYHYQPEIFTQPHKNVFFDGFWQTEKYFAHCADVIKKSFSFREDKLNTKSKEIANYILEQNSISVHVRRGDYQSASFKDTLGSACTTDYYIRAIQLISKNVDNPLFVFFSDDINWVKQNLFVENAIYVDHNKKEDSWQDMYLMSRCKHNIIANSSFSWWGAWLNSNANKIVIAPKTWWGQHVCEDVVPSEWVRL